MKQTRVLGALALGTSMGLVLGGGAMAQGITVTASGDNQGAQILTTPTFPGQSTGYQAFQITIDDAAAFSVMPASNTVSSSTLFAMFSDTADLTGEIVASNNSSPDGSLASQFVSNGVTGLTSTGLSEGQYYLFVSPTTVDTVPQSFVIIFDLFGAVLGWGPSTAEELAALLGAAGGSGRLMVVGADGVVRDAGAVSLATRDGRLSLTRVANGTAAGDVSISTSGLPGMMGNLYTWAEVTGFRSTTYGTGDGTLGGTGLQIGADIAIAPNMVAGLSLGYSEINAEDNGVTTDGTYTYLQPYFAYRSGAWHGNASLVYGVGSFDQSSLGGDGTADVTLTALTFEGGYDYSLADGYTLTPTLGLIHGREEVEGTGGTLAGTSDTVTFSQLSLGGRVTYDGPDGTLFAGLHADYLTQDVTSVLAADLLAEDGWTGRVEVGGEMALSNGMGLSTSVELSGLGGDMQTVSGGLRVAFTF